MHILLTEDDVFLQRVYAQELRKAGHDVRCAHDGQQAIDMLKESIPDILILDIIMPGKTGFDVLKERSGHPKLAKVPAIMFSSLAQESDMEKAKQLGAVDYIVKSTMDGNDSGGPRKDIELLLKAIEKFSSPPK